MFMKMEFGVVAVGLIAGTTFLAVGGKTEEPVKPKAPSVVEGPTTVTEKKPKFDIPVWHPDARWQQDPDYFCGFSETVQGGELDGPRRETMHCQGAGPGLVVSRMTTGGRSVLLSYDEKTERYHTMAGSAHGCLDGPFSRARFQGTSYVALGKWLTSSGNRYGYYFSTFDYKLRLLDLEKQEVRTLLTDRKLYGASMAVDAAGRLLILKGNDLLVMTPEGKVDRTVQLKGEPPRALLGDRGGDGPRIEYDEIHDRLYACSASTRLWYLVYWDLKDGSFHGVLPVVGKDQWRKGDNPMHTSAGPFQGTVIYGEGNIWFGPGDTEKRFLYLGQTDCWTSFRLDLEKQEIWAATEEKGIISFIGSGKPKYRDGESIAYRGPIWAPNGNDFFGYVGNGYRRYQRVK
jgi:hypothetical protein